MAGDNWDVWIQDIERGVRTRLTTDAAVEAFPVWAPDDARVIFMSNRDAPGRDSAGSTGAGSGAGGRETVSERWDLYHKPASGAVTERLLRDGEPNVQSLRAGGETAASCIR